MISLTAGSKSTRHVIWKPILVLEPKVAIKQLHKAGLFTVSKSSKFARIGAAVHTWRVTFVPQIRQPGFWVAIELGSMDLSQGKAPPWIRGELLRLEGGLEARTRDTCRKMSLGKEALLRSQRN